MRIDLSKEMSFYHASFRYFKEREHHIKRFCSDDVLLLVFDGVLRFSEGEREHEVSAGEYYIQHHLSHQDGRIASSAPKYLYVHFLASYTEDNDENGLPTAGRFDFATAYPLMKKLDELSHANSTLIEQKAVFYSLLFMLKPQNAPRSQGELIEQYLNLHYKEDISLNLLSENFSYSKNQIINLFRERYGIPPMKYLRKLRIDCAKRLLESTSDTLAEIAAASGFCDYVSFYRAFEASEGVSPGIWRTAAHDISGKRR